MVFVHALVVHAALHPGLGLGLGLRAGIGLGQGRGRGGGTRGRGRGKGRGRGRGRKRGRVTGHSQLALSIGPLVPAVSGDSLGPG